MDRKEKSVFDVLTTLFWSLIGTTVLPVLIPWIIYVIFRKRKTESMGGKVVMITGCSSGLGEQLADTFYTKGCKVIIASRRVEELERVKDDLLEYLHDDDLAPPEPVILQLDLSNIKSIPAKIDEVCKAHGGIDILINNAGISYRGKIADTSVEVDQELMMVNYFGLVALTKAVLPHMIRKGHGHIVAISSVQGRIAIPFRSAYAASKHAVQAFMDSLRAEVKKDNIKVTVVNPGYIKTNLSINAMTANGNKYGVMDPSTSKGYEPRFVAERIYNSIVKGEKETTIAGFQPKAAMVLRFVFPSLYFYLMEKRAESYSPTID